MCSNACCRFQRYEATTVWMHRMDFDDWRSAKGSPDPIRGYITLAKTDSESMLLEPSQPQLYEAVLVKPVPAEEDVSGCTQLYFAIPFSSCTHTDRTC
jgi:hypothetical protein